MSGLSIEMIADLITRLIELYTKEQVEVKVQVLYVLSSLASFKSTCKTSVLKFCKNVEISKVFSLNP